MEWKCGPRSKRSSRIRLCAGVDTPAFSMIAAAQTLNAGRVMCAIAVVITRLRANKLGGEDER